MKTKIEKIIEDLDEYIDSCKPAAFSKTNIIVDKSTIENFIDELKHYTPEEIKRYKSIVSNKDAIMTDAQNRADSLIEKAQAYTDKMINEHTIMQEAYSQAGEIVNQARQQAQELVDSAAAQANDIQLAAIEYMDTSLREYQSILSDTIEEVRSHEDSLISRLSEMMDTVGENRQQLNKSVEDSGFNDVEAPMMSDSIAARSNTTPVMPPVSAGSDQADEVIDEESPDEGGVIEDDDDFGDLIIDDDDFDFDSDEMEELR
ncbi:MAG: ATPase [Lachnospiraceae bacterium]|nr:ATPase [Lachnospiraceae bacterium]